MVLPLVVLINKKQIGINKGILHFEAFGNQTVASSAALHVNNWRGEGAAKDSMRNIKKGAAKDSMRNIKNNQAKKENPERRTCCCLGAGH